MKKYFPILSVLILIIFFVQYYLCIKRSSMFEEQKLLDRQILASDIRISVEQLKNKDIQVLDFRSIARFSWEKLYIFIPYTSEKSIKSILSINHSWGLGTTVDTNNGVVFIVFVRKGEIVQSLDYFKSDGDFSSLVNADQLPIAYAEFIYEHAQFTQNKEGDFIWIGEP